MNTPAATPVLPRFEPRAPAYAWGQRVMALDDLINDGSHPERAPDALLAERGSLGEIVNIGYASDLECDGSGRVLVPPALREYAGLDKKAVLVGQGNKMELWDEDTWLAERDKWLQMASVEGAVPDEMLRLSL